MIKGFSSFILKGFFVVHRSTTYSDHLAKYFPNISERYRECRQEMDDGRKIQVCTFIRQQRFLPAAKPAFLLLLLLLE